MNTGLIKQVIDGVARVFHRNLPYFGGLPYSGDCFRPLGPLC